jgi:hypothetical protein
VRGYPYILPTGCHYPHDQRERRNERMGELNNLRNMVCRRYRGDSCLRSYLLGTEMTIKNHRWDADGETCLDCGDKDWMGGSCNAAPIPPTPGQQEALNCLDELSCYPYDRDERSDCLLDIANKLKAFILARPEEVTK